MEAWRLGSEDGPRHVGLIVTYTKVYRLLTKFYKKSLLKKLEGYNTYLNCIVHKYLSKGEVQEGKSFSHLEWKRGRL